MKSIGHIQQVRRDVGMQEGKEGAREKQAPDKPKQAISILPWVVQMTSLASL